MRRRSTLILCALAFLHLGGSAQAQNWRPFAAGRTYHYRQTATQAGQPDRLFTLQVDSVYVQGADSVFCFNRVNVPDPANHFGAPAWARANLFGGWLYWNAGSGEARFRSQGRQPEVVVQTRAVVGQSWGFAPGVTAQVLARQPRTTHGRADTVLVIGLSDGRQLQLSRRWGLLAGPNFDAYIGRTNYTTSLQALDLLLTAIPELGIGTADLRWDAIYDLRAGDRLWYRATWRAPWLAYRLHEHRQRTIVGRRVLAGGMYRIEFTEVLRQEYWSANQARLDSVQFTANRAGADTIRTWGRPLLTGHPGNADVNVDPALEYADTLGGLPVVESRLAIIDVYNSDSYAPGLGQVRVSREGMNLINGLQRLTGFDKGGVQWGQTTTPLGVEEPPTAGWAMLSPNPSAAAREPVLWLTSGRAQTASLLLYDALGRVVWGKEAVLTRGEQCVRIAMTDRPAGVYRLRVVLADGRQRVLPLVRE